MQKKKEIISAKESVSSVLCRCKYLYLLYDDTFLLNQNYVFTTEGHPLPVLSDWHERLPETDIPTNRTFVKVCVNTTKVCTHHNLESIYLLMNQKHVSWQNKTPCKFLFWLGTLLILPWNIDILTEEDLTLQSGKQARQASAMSLQICPATTWSSGACGGGQQVESVCHILDARSDHRCSTDEECGVDSTTCRSRSCSIAGYCGLWLFI